jgi:lactate dehydrogenase-like 2-hydroxyacid dehydrogenase
MKAFIFEPLWDSLVTPELTSELSGAGVDYAVIQEVAPLANCEALFEGDEERLLYINPDYVGWKLGADDYKDIPNLKGIFLASTGYDYVDQSYATERNIPINNIKGFSAEAVAEWSVMVMFNLARQMPRIIKDGYPLDFDADFMKYRGIELHGKTAGIVGLGRIGKLIARRCQGLGMKVVYWSKNSRDEDYEYLELEELMSSVDVIFPIMAVNEESAQILDVSLLEKMKTSAILVDPTHKLFDITIPIGMVRDGKLFGYGFEAEPKSFNMYEGNIWAVPEYAWATDASMQASVRMQVENLVLASKGEFPNRIN